ncbi:2-hydroxyacid dehydrogenase [Octadecabacter ascidiaceicola]|uniref:Glyoxylate/hydroxypyruvate reductase A n=1 Tax=Octadecabacter ascidiaceicola TaxID=1655543 RepID=A0A238KQ05_9RHOB|nr:glyoxylate/hydroxypyruvate reductase A [Octadecabacter ascidiaceicola]SMX44875.1 Glyoxylate/hydroxypyruvate reductase A [Octadecabacter ascidiaceicola]
MIRALFSAGNHAWPEYQETLPPAFRAAGLTVDLSREHAPEKVDYIIAAPNGPVQDFTPFTSCKAVLNLWAGVEDIVSNTTLTQPLARMVDPGLTDGMVEWVVGHTMRHHLGMDAHIHGQDGVWRTDYPPLAQDRPVTVLGLGALGAACAQMLASLGFPVTGWSRSQKALQGVRCLSSDTGLTEALTGAEIVVLLLPLTDATTDILNAGTLALLADGAFIINPGRGPLIDDAALIAALDTNIAHATLDVFRREPLPENHPFWKHPQVTVTPHIASTTRAKTAATCIAENIRRGEAGEPFLHLVDRSKGY